MKKNTILGLIVVILLSLILAGCYSTSDNSSSTDTYQVTLEMHTKMIDFSTGEIITEEGTSEDLDVITGAKEGFVRLIARNGAEIMISGNAEYSLYVDAYEGAECELIDRQGGKATFTVDEIGTNTSGLPTVTITWSYIY